MRARGFDGSSRLRPIAVTLAAAHVGEDGPAYRTGPARNLVSWVVGLLAAARVAERTALADPWRSRKT
jgi:hypothetical protein